HQDALRVGDLLGDRVEVLRVVWVEMVHVMRLPGAHVVVRTMCIGRYHSLRLGRLPVLRVFFGQTVPDARLRLRDHYNVERLG
ncbi:MAG: hypothetical protein EB143_03295, partial [Actinobacteria bacterium]|nr:hypothetical protein [Actinomycetota bacterium]